MSWLDEALARQSAQRTENATDSAGAGADEPDARLAHEVRALDALVQQLLADYGARVCGRTFRGRGYATALEAPGRKAAVGGTDEMRWTWHWHLHSYVRGVSGIEVHPRLNERGEIVALDVRSARSATTCAPDEDGLKEALVRTYNAAHRAPER